MGIKIALIAFPVMDYRRGTLQPIGMDLVRECPPLSLYWLSEVCAASGINVLILDLVATGGLLGWGDIDDLVDCDLIGITTTSLSWPAALDGIRKIRKVYPKIPIVLG